MYCRRLISDASRRQPTIRLAVSDFWGIRQVTVCRAAQTLGPGTYACRGSSDTWNPGGLSGGVMAPLLCPLRHCRPEAQIADACGVSQTAPWAARPSKDGRLRLTFGDCSPESETSTFNSRLRKKVIAGHMAKPGWYTGFVRSVFGLCSFRLPPRAKDG